MPSNVVRAGARRVARRALLACAGLGITFSAAATIAPLPLPVPPVAAPAFGASLPVPLGTAVRQQSRRPYRPQPRLIDAHVPPSDPFTPPGASPRNRVAAGASGLAGDGIPVVALMAYRYAAQLADRADPDCHLSWTLLAGIGRVESDHGRFAGAALLSDGTSSTKIIGIALNGNGTEVVTDTDGGRLDGDRVFDRAVGPMQFIPSTWAAYGTDADRDGIADPFDINDAALAAAHYLCASGADLSTRSGQITAVLTYNHSAAYVAEVLSLAAAYAAGVTPVSGGVVALGAPPTEPTTVHRPGAITPSTSPRPPLTTPTAGRTSARRPPSAGTSTQATSPGAPSSVSVSVSTSTSATRSTSMTNSSSTSHGTTTGSTPRPCPTSSTSSSVSTTASDSVTATVTETTTVADSSSSATDSATDSAAETSTSATCAPAAHHVQTSAAAAAPGVVVLALLVLIGAGVRRRSAQPAHV